MKREDLLDLNEAVQNPGRHLTFSINTELPQEEDLDLVQPIQGELNAVSTGNMLLIESDLEAKCVVECARCGAPLTVEFEFSMDDQFPIEGIPSCYGSGGMAKIVPDEPYPLFHNNALIRDAYVRQGLILNIPIQATCEEVLGEPCKVPVHLVDPDSQGHPAMKVLEGLRGDADKE